MRGHYYLLAVAAGFGVAIALSSHELCLTVLAVSVFVYLSYKYRSKLTFGLLILVTFGVFLWALFYDGRNETVLSDEIDIVQGNVTDVPVLDGDRVSFLLQLQERKERIRVSVRVTEEEALSSFRNLKPGSECIIEGEIQPPLDARNFNAFNYREYLYEQHVHWTFHHVQGENDMSCHAVSGTVSSFLKQWRHSGIRMIEEVFPQELQGLAQAMLFGERSNIESDTLDAYQDLGIIHLLAISGLHVGIVSGVFFFLLIRMGISRERASEILMFVLPVYALLAGAAPSVLRAVLMSCFVLFCFRFRFRLHPVDGLSFAFFALLMYNPYLLFHVGFQLSFTISTALICSATIFKRLKTRLRQFLMVSILAQVISFPLIVYHFHTYSLISLPLNIFYVPVISILILPMVWILFFLSMLSPFISSIWLFFLEKAIRVFHTFFTFIHQNHGGILTFGQASGYWVFFSFLFILLALMLFEKKQKTAALAAALVLMLAVYQYMTPYLDGRLRVTFIDVGQGDSILIELPYKRAVYLIDGGGTVMFPQESWQEQRREPDPGRQTVVPYLQSLGIKRLDKVIVTHGDYDHYGGLEVVIEKMNVDLVLYPRVPIEKPGVETFLRNVIDQGTRIEFVHEGMQWTVDEHAFRILNPEQESRGLSDNEDSIVIDANVYGKKWLFTGDLEEEGEKRLVQDYPELRTDILKAGHHGSQSSTTAPFVQHIQPEVSIISAGENNRFNHPHPDVIDTLERENVHIFRTDRQGAIRFYHHEQEWYVETMISD